MAEKQVIDNSEILRFVAKKLGARVRKENCYDANVCEAEFSEETKWRARVLSGYPFSLGLRTTFRDRRVHAMCNPDYVSCSVFGQLDVEQCSINCPNKISYVNQPSQLSVRGDFRWAVFLRAGQQPSVKLQKLLDDPAFHNTVQRLIRGPSESLHLFANAVTLYSKPNSGDEMVDVIDALSSLVGQDMSEVESVDFTVLPLSLQNLIPLIKRWAVPDDSERSDLLDEAPESELANHNVTLMSPVSMRKKSRSGCLPRSRASTGCVTSN